MKVEPSEPIRNELARRIRRAPRVELEAAIWRLMETLAAEAFVGIFNRQRRLDQAFIAIANEHGLGDRR